MSETVRTLDVRTSTDADGNKYFVVFCARESDNATSKPGHAFVVWGVEDNQSQRSSEKSLGFYPDPNDESKAIFGAVSGQLRNEALQAGTSSLLHSRLIVRVNKQSFEQSQDLISDWATSDYNLYSNNCIHFARAVAVSLSLFPPSVATFQFPASYLKQLIATTTQNAEGGSRSIVSWTAFGFASQPESMSVLGDGTIICYDPRFRKLGRIGLQELTELDRLISALPPTQQSSNHDMKAGQVLICDNSKIRWSPFDEPNVDAFKIVQWLRSTKSKLELESLAPHSIETELIFSWDSARSGCGRSTIRVYKNGLVECSGPQKYESSNLAVFEMAEFLSLLEKLPSAGCSYLPDGSTGLNVERVKIGTRQFFWGVALTDTGYRSFLPDDAMQKVLNWIDGRKFSAMHVQEIGSESMIVSPLEPRLGVGAHGSVEVTILVSCSLRRRPFC